MLNGRGYSGRSGSRCRHADSAEGDEHVFELRLHELETVHTPPSAAICAGSRRTTAAPCPGRTRRCSRLPKRWTASTSPSARGRAGQQCLRLARQLDDAPGQALAKLARRAFADEAATAQEADPRAARRLVHIGRADQHGDLLLAQQRDDEPPEVLPGDRVDARGRLVQEQDARPVDQCQGQPQLLLHPAGELAGPPIAELLPGPQIPESPGCAASIAGWQAAHLGEELEVLQHGQVFVEREALCQVAELLARPLQLAGHLEVANVDLAGVLVQGAAQEAQEGRLAGAVRPDQAEDFSRGDT